jgi:hypothetical protein
MEEQREECYMELIRSAAQRLTGHERRAFIAEVTQTLCDDNPRQSERLFGWGRETVALGIHERDSGHLSFTRHRRGVRISHKRLRDRQIRPAS